MNNKAILAIAVLVVLTGGMWYMRGATTPPTPPSPAPIVATEQPASGQNNSAGTEPVATGKVDDLLASFDGEQSQEAAAVTAGDANAEAVLSDGTAINDLSQTYDETQL